jgi:hypothetical protein
LLICPVYPPDPPPPAYLPVPLYLFLPLRTFAYLPAYLVALLHVCLLLICLPIWKALASLLG